MPQDDKNPTAQVPGMPMINLELTRSWMDTVPGLREKRAAMARQFMRASGDDGATRYDSFPGGIEEMYERGLIDVEPQDDRLLLRSVHADDAAGSELHTMAPDARVPMLQEVLAIGPACERYWRERDYKPEQMPKVGDFVWVLVTVADRLATKDKKIRMMTVRAMYVGSRIVIKNPA